MREVTVDSIPQHLMTRFDEENMINKKLEEDLIFIQESYTVHIVSFDIVKEWKENGIM